MSASQSGVYNTQQFTDMGAPLVGGRLFTYAFGTTTHKTAYTDHAGAIPHAYSADGLGGQFIALDARGELPAPLYLTGGSYDLALKTAAGATVWTRRADPVWDITNDLSASSGASLVGYMPTGTGAVPRTVQDKSREIVSVKDFGAVGNGITDDAPAVDLCGAYLDAIGGGTMVFPDGTYRLATMYGSNHTLIRPRSNVTFKGMGRGSTLKAANGLNNSAPFGFNVIYPEESTAGYTYSNMSVVDLTFDLNGTNNISANITTAANVAIGSRYGSNYLVENCLFLNNAGKQSVSFGSNVSTPTVSKVVIRNNEFHNCGKAVTGNTTQNDHSSIYCLADTYQIFGNTFNNDTADKVSTAVEMHGFSGTAYGNAVKNFGQMFNLASTVCDLKTALFYGNTGDNVDHFGTLWSYNGFNHDSVVDGNKATFPLSLVTVTDATTNTQASALSFKHRFSNNELTYTGGVNATNVPHVMDIGKVSRLEYYGNKVDGFMGRALTVSSVLPGAEITVRNNQLDDLPSTAIGGYVEAVFIAPTGGTIASLKIKDNIAKGCKTYLYQVPDIALTISELIESGNTIDSTMTDVGHILTTPTLGAGKISINRTGNRSPYTFIRASLGSKVFDQVRGIEWRMDAAGEVALAWHANYAASAIPAAGAWTKGSYTRNSVPSVGAPKGWVCTADGVPGTWVSEGNL